MVRALRDRVRRPPAFRGVDDATVPEYPPPQASACSEAPTVPLDAPPEAWWRDLRPSAVISGALIFSLALVINGVRRTVTPDIHVDEFIYSGVTQQVAAGHSLIIQGQQFFWQPPLFMVFAAPIIKVFGLTSTGAVDLLLQMRLINVVIGALTAVVMLALGWKLRGAWTGWAMSLLFVTDPFTIRVTRRLYLEPFASLWVLLGLWLVLSSHGRWTWRRRIATGMLFGCALLSKEVLFFTLAIPFVLWIRRQMSWREPFTILGTAVLVYGLYPLWAVLVGEGSGLGTVKLFQFKRLIGAVRFTGVNRPGVSFADALVANAADYWTSYLIIGLAAPATVWLFFRKDPGSRFLGSWAGVTYVYFIGLAKFGTLNDQFFYFLMLPVVAVLGYTFAFNLPRLQSGFRDVLSSPKVNPRRVLWQLDASLVAVLLALIVLGPNVQIWVERFGIQHDDGVAVLEQQINGHIPDGAIVAAPGFAYSELQFIYPNGRYRLTSERNPVTLANLGVHWFVMATKDIAIANGMTKPYYDAITVLATPVWSTDEHTQFHLGLWYVDNPRRLATITVAVPPDPKTPGPFIATS